MSAHRARVSAEGHSREAANGSMWRGASGQRLVRRCVASEAWRDNEAQCKWEARHEIRRVSEARREARRIVWRRVIATIGGAQGVVGTR